MAGNNYKCIIYISFLFQSNEIDTTILYLPIVCFLSVFPASTSEFWLSFSVVLSRSLSSAELPDLFMVEISHLLVSY